MAPSEPNYYQVLGVAQDATAQTIKLAYRRLALKFHPDRSKSSATVDKFLEITHAFDVLSDPGRRSDYDRILAFQATLALRAKPRANPADSTPAKSRGPNRPKKSEDKPSVVEDVSRLMKLFARGRYAEAESLATLLMERDPKQAAPYAVLADIVRARGDFHRAAKLYALAAQMDPRNTTYMRKHEDILAAIAARPAAVYVAAQREAQMGQWAPFAGFAVPVFGCIYLSLAREQPIFPSIGFLSTWTFGLAATLLLSGVSVGASLSLGDVLDRFETYTQTVPGRLSPSVALLFVAMVNFWAAGAIYIQAGWLRKSFQLSTTWLLFACAGIVGVAALGATVGGRIDAAQVLLWGGNLAYLGGVCGWMVADSLKR